MAGKSGKFKFWGLEGLKRRLLEGSRAGNAEKADEVSSISSTLGESRAGNAEKEVGLSTGDEG